MNYRLRTKVRDTILSNCSPGLDADAVQGVEWAAVEDTNQALSQAPLEDWAVYDPRDPDKWEDMS